MIYKEQFLKKPKNNSTFPRLKPSRTPQPADLYALPIATESSTNADNCCVALETLHSLYHRY